MWFTSAGDMYRASDIKSVLVDEWLHGKFLTHVAESLFLCTAGWLSGSMNLVSTLCSSEMTRVRRGLSRIRNDNGVHHECVPRVGGNLRQLKILPVFRKRRRKIWGDRFLLSMLSNVVVQSAEAERRFESAPIAVPGRTKLNLRWTISEIFSYWRRGRHRFHVNPVASVVHETAHENGELRVFREHKTRRRRSSKYALDTWKNTRGRRRSRRTPL